VQCIRCSPGRSTEAHRKAKVLGVTIDNIGVKFGCNHCRWTGGGYFRSNSSGRNDGFPAVYDYHNKEGKLFFQKVRNYPGREPRFWFRHPDGNGGWANGTGGADTTILYRLPEVIEAIANDREIVPVEGEKDADNLWAIGIPATCNAHGAADPTKNQKPKWTLAHSEQLRGARIVVLNDNDASGYAHAEATCKLSLGISKRVRRLDLKQHWPDMPEKADVSDWLAIPGNSREKLDALMEIAPDYDDKPADGLPIVHWHGEADPRDSRPQLIQDLIPEVGCGLISGQWGTYKTFTALDIAHSVMSREPFLGFEVMRPGGVLFIALEGQSEIALRVEGVIKERGKFNGAHAPFAWIETCPPLTSANAVAILTKLTEHIAAKLKAEFDLPLSLIEIDTVIVAAGYTKEGADNDTALGQMVMGALAQLAQNAHCFVFGIDHFSKDVNVGTRGTSAKEGRADVVLALLGDKAVSGEVTNTRLALRKRRGGANGQEFSFKPRVVDMGVNSLGKEETTLVLDWGTAVAPAKTAKDNWGKSKGVRLLRQIIMSMLVDQGVSLTPWSDGPTVRALKLEAVKAEFIKAYYTDGETEAAKKRAKRVAFERAIRAAASADARGVIVTREVNGIEYVWLRSARAEAEATTAGADGRKPADDPAPAQTPDDGVSVPFILTAAQKEALHALGYSDEQIREMTPQQGHDILAQRRKLAGVLAAWLAAIGASQRHTAEQVIAAANGADDEGDKLKLVLMAVAAHDNGIDSTRLEQWLRANSGVEVDQLTLREAGTDKDGRAQWTLKLRVEPDKWSGAD